MRRYFQPILTAIVFVTVASSTWAQHIVVFDPPKYYPAKQAPSRRELELRDSMYKYVDGLMFLNEERYSDALRAFEDAARLDPNAPGNHQGADTDPDRNRSLDRCAQGVSTGRRARSGGLFDLVHPGQAAKVDGPLSRGHRVAGAAA